jgi:predicted deacylase
MQPNRLHSSQRRGTTYLRHLALILLMLGAGPSAMTIATAAEHSEALQLLGRNIAPGTKKKFPYMPDDTFEASYLNTPVFVARGLMSGPTLCLTAGVHGDELNGVEIARRVFAEINAQTLRGTIIALPTINAEGVRSGTRYLTDRRDLNRAFPGSATGSVASLIAQAIFAVISEHCDALVDLHTASNRRSNLPQIRADLADPAIRELAIHFGLGVVVDGSGPDGSLRRETAKAGIPAIIYEAGEPFRFQQAEINRGVHGVENVMAYLEMADHPIQEIPDDRIYDRSRWVRTPVGNGGFFFPTATMGDNVKTGDSLGNVIDPFTDKSYEIVSPKDGEIIGMANSQPVLSGYALFHIAWRSSD